VWSFPDFDRLVVLRLLPQQRERPVNGFVQRVRLDVLTALNPVAVIQEVAAIDAHGGPPFET